MKVKNEAGRMVETRIAGVTFKPFSGARKYEFTSKLTSLEKALKACELKNGMTV